MSDALRRSQERPSQSDLIVAAELLKNAAGLERKPHYTDGASGDPSGPRSGSAVVFRAGGLPAASTELSHAYLDGEQLDAGSCLQRRLSLCHARGV